MSHSAFRVYGTGPTYPVFRPQYLSLTERASLSRHTGNPILESYNSIYHYWTTTRDLTIDEVRRYLGANYLRNMPRHREPS